MSSLPRSLIAAALLIGLVYLIACAGLYLLQRRFIYYPTSRNPATPAFVLPRPDAQVVVSSADAAGDAAVLYFGGNAEDVSTTMPGLARIFPGIAVYAMHYRGYGGSTGSPTERALVDDGIALRDHIAVTHPRITLIGRSLGSGIAVQVAAARGAERLVLVTPYDSIAGLAAAQFRYFPVHWLLQDKYESWRHAGRLRMPTTIVIAGNDEVIPGPSSERLAGAFPSGVAEVVRIPEADHNNVSGFARYEEALRATWQR